MAKKIGITGGIGTGKTSACKLFEQLDIPVFYADYEAKWLMMNKAEIKSELISLFGEQAYLDGELNRGFLAQKIFSDATLKSKMEQIIHPAVALHFKEWADKHKDKQYVLKEAALIYETRGEQKLDAVIVVHADEQIRIQRVMSRDQSTEAQVQDRIKNQMDQMIKVKKADFLIENNDDLAALKTAVTEAHHTILNWIKTTS